MSRTFVVGLDGGSWRLAETWIEAGELPNLTKLRKGGTWGECRSCLPPVTFPNWKCYSAGKNPGKLGVFWFERIDLEAERVDIMNGRDFRTAELWDYLNDAGLTAGIINMPTMYPPRSINGLVVCGGPDAVEGEYRSIDTGYTFPEDLEEKLESAYDYRVHPNPLLSSNQERGEEVEEILRLLEIRFRVAVDLFEREQLDFVHVTLFYLNVLQHFFWNEGPTKRAWKIIDEWLGRIADLDDTNLFVMSDHGSAPTKTEFYVNEWLAKEGYLTETYSVDDILKRIGITRERALRGAKRLGVVDVLSRVVPQRFQKLIPQTAGAKRERKLEKIDLDKTLAVASGQGPIYLNPAHNDQTVRERLIADLQAVEDDDGLQLFTNVYRSEELYSGSYVNLGPEVVVDQRPGVHVNDGLGGGEVMTEPDRWAAENTPHGIFVSNGPDIESGGELDGVRILDIAPTILAGLGLDVPSDMDGRVLPIYTEEPDVGTRDPIPFDEVEGERYDEVAERLKQLGYME